MKQQNERIDKNSKKIQAGKTQGADIWPARLGEDRAQGWGLSYRHDKISPQNDTWSWADLLWYEKCRTDDKRYANNLTQHQPDRKKENETNSIYAEVLQVKTENAALQTKLSEQEQQMISVGVELLKMRQLHTALVQGDFILVLFVFLFTYDLNWFYQLWITIKLDLINWVFSVFKHTYIIISYCNPI